MIMRKITKEEALEAYKQSWQRELSNAEIAEKYHVTKAHISAIKNGYNWSSVTLHKRGSVPSIAHKPFDEKMSAILKKTDVAVTIDNRFWDLSEECGSDIAYLFKQKIYDTRG